MLPQFAVSPSQRMIPGSSLSFPSGPPPCDIPDSSSTHDAPSFLTTINDSNLDDRIHQLLLNIGTYPFLARTQPWTTGGSTVLKPRSPGAKQHGEDDKGSRRVVRDFGGWGLLGAACAGGGLGWVCGGGCWKHAVGVRCNGSEGYVGCLRPKDQVSASGMSEIDNPRGIVDL